ncbi:uncharacterized protein LOC103211796 [Orycteropus afer afer]|uniref:Uncharacterized protein LOC103211796 n=1 Tax=Orycteropus afer afer TaxID=1230840 RepID=A0A8B7B6Z3_ORYAF|nr:uncharacterized protein LOC103211796 [Orycteropus afer afer]
MDNENSRLERKHFLRKLTGLVLIYLSLGFGVILANSRKWRVWEFEGRINTIMFIGLWKVLCIHTFNISTVAAQTVKEHTLNETWVIPNAITYGQDLILLANFMKLLVLVFAMLAYLVSMSKDTYPHFCRFMYKICSIFILLSSFCTLGTAIWNFIDDKFGTTFEFPLNFTIRKEDLTHKRSSYAFPLAIITAFLSVISALNFLYDQYLLNPRFKVKPLDEHEMSE